MLQMKVRAARWTRDTKRTDKKMIIEKKNRRNDVTWIDRERLGEQGKPWVGEDGAAETGLGPPNKCKLKSWRKEQTKTNANTYIVLRSGKE